MALQWRDQRSTSGHLRRPDASTRFAADCRHVLAHPIPLHEIAAAAGVAHPAALQLALSARCGQCAGTGVARRLCRPDLGWRLPVRRRPRPRRDHGLRGRRQRAHRRTIDGRRGRRCARPSAAPHRRPARGTGCAVGTRCGRLATEAVRWRRRGADIARAVSAARSASGSADGVHLRPAGRSSGATPGCAVRKPGDQRASAAAALPRRVRLWAQDAGADLAAAAFPAAGSQPAPR